VIMEERICERDEF